MGVKLNPISTIKAKVGINPEGPVQKFLTQTCYKHMDKYVPTDGNGILRSVVDIETNSITYQSPYAHYQYIGKLYVDPETGSPFARRGVTKVPTDIDLMYHTPGTGSYWDKRMVSAEIDTVCREVEKKFGGHK